MLEKVRMMVLVDGEGKVLWREGEDERWWCSAVEVVFAGGPVFVEGIQGMGWWQRLFIIFPVRAAGLFL